VLGPSEIGLLATVGVVQVFFFEVGRPRHFFLFFSVHKNVHSECFRRGKTDSFGANLANKRDLMGGCER
jgi:hypothetical protein